MLLSFTATLICVSIYGKVCGLCEVLYCYIRGNIVLRVLNGMLRCYLDDPCHGETNHFDL